MLVEIESIAALDAEELAIDSGTVAVVGANDVAIANAERGLAAVRAVRADSAHVLHFPGTCFIAISAAGERANRANVDARAALVALQVIAMVRHDLRGRAAIANTKSADAKPFTANPDATVAEN